MSEPYNSLQTLNEYKGTWGVELGSKAVTVVAPSMELAAKVLNSAGAESGDPITIQCIKQQIQVQMPEIFVSFVTEAIDTTGIAKDTCFAYPKMYTLLAGTKQVFTAVPGDGFKFVKWEINGKLVDDAVTGEPATTEVAVLQIPASPTTIKITAVFETDPDGP